MRIRKHLRLTTTLSAATGDGDGDPSSQQSSVFSLHTHLPPLVFDSSSSSLKVTKVEDLDANGSCVGNNSIEADDSEKCGDGEVTKLNVEEEERLVMCGKNDGKRWRCKKQAEKGKVLCNHHLEQLRNYDITKKKKMMEKMKTEKWEEEVEERIVLCNKRNGNWWKCKKQAAKGKVLCEHHLDQLRNHQNKKKIKTEKETERGDQVRGRVRAKKAALDSNPYDYYYYSGFGPSWGKKRGNTNTNTNNIKNTEFVEIEYSKCSDDDDDEIGKKRGGSPIINAEEDEERMVFCRRMNGSGWKCHAVAARGKLLCERHLEEKINYESKKKMMKMMKKDRAAPVVMNTTFLSNSHLCSGNGTADWGKNIAVDQPSPYLYQSSHSEIDRIRIDYAELDDSDDDEDKESDEIRKKSHQGVVVVDSFRDMENLI